MPPPSELGTREQLEHDLWLAIIDLESGNRRQAVRRGADVATEAEKEGFVSLFMDVGPPAERLLRAVQQGGSVPYAEKLLELLESSNGAGLPGPAHLSERELEVVRYLPTTLSSAEIASQLYISLNTLKTHLRMIYRKLGVNGRREAIERAEALGIT